MVRTVTVLTLAMLLAGCASTKPSAPKTGGAGQSGGSAETIRFASTDGRFIGFADGSLWNIDWRDAGKARTWSAGSRVRVTKARGGEFPYRITDSAGNSVGARHGKRLD